MNNNNCDTANLEHIPHNKELYDVYESLFIDEIAKVTSKYFKSNIDNNLIDVCESVLTKHKNLKYLTFRFRFPGGKSDNYNEYGYNIKNNDGGFMFRFCVVYKKYKNHLRKISNECLKLEKVDSVLNTEDYIFSFLDIDVVPICDCLYHAGNDKLHVTNNIIIKIYFTEEDISMYKPGGDGAKSSETSYNKVLLMR